MNTYEIKYGGNKVKQIKGVNLETALINEGFTNVRITPNWRGRSNRKYTAYCSEQTIIQCSWI